MGAWMNRGYPSQLMQPKKVFDQEKIVRIYSSYYHAAFLTEHNQVYTFGHNMVQ